MAPHGGAATAWLLRDSREPDAPVVWPPRLYAWPRLPSSGLRGVLERPPSVLERPPTRRDSTLGKQSRSNKLLRGMNLAAITAASPRLDDGRRGGVVSRATPAGATPRANGARAASTSRTIHGVESFSESHPITKDGDAPRSLPRLTPSRTRARRAAEAS